MQLLPTKIISMPSNTILLPNRANEIAYAAQQIRLQSLQNVSTSQRIEATGFKLENVPNTTRATLFEHFEKVKDIKNPYLTSESQLSVAFPNTVIVYCNINKLKF